MSISVSVAIELALLAAFACVVTVRSRFGRGSRTTSALLGCIAVASLIPHLQGVRLHTNGIFHVHPTEFYHYYLGTKYFPECGYYGLYEAATIAEFELDPEGFRPEETLRHLRNPQFEVRKGELLRKREAIRSRFSAARWREFLDDYAFLQTFDLRSWGTHPPERDHGYNGTPATTALLGGLARFSGLPAARFIPVAAWLDLLTLLGLVAVVGLAVRWEVAFAFLTLWALNPLNDYGFTGGAYLRHAHFVALCLGLVLLRSQRLFASGVALAAAVGLRILPVVFAAASVAHDLVNPGRIARIRTHRALYAGGAFGVVLLVVATWPVRSPDGSNAWTGFAERIERHAENWSPNRIGLPFLLAYSADHELDAPELRNGTARGPKWRAAMKNTLSERWLLRGALVVVGLGVSLLYLRAAPYTEAPYVGLLWLFLLAVPSHYDYALLGIVPLVFPDARRWWLALAALEATLLLLGASESITRSPDRAYAAYSAAVGVFLVGIAALHARLGPSPSAPSASEPTAHDVPRAD